MNCFLEGGFVISEEGCARRLGGDFIELRSEDFLEDEFAGDFEAGVEVEGGENGFQSVHQEGGFVATTTFFLAAAEPEEASEIEFLGDLDEMTLADQVGANLGELALVKFGEALEESFAGDETEDGVAKEFELFVVADAGARFGGLQGFLFARLRAMGESLIEESGAAEMVTEGGFQIRDVVRLHGPGMKPCFIHRG